ncbi:MAG: hypothetical protein ACFFCS_29985 [Candidatus Hodarchaeota archaeon]
MKFSLDDDSPLDTMKSAKKSIPDPRSIGGVLLESRKIPDSKGAKCSECNSNLSMDIFYFSGKARKFVRCECCDKYLFELSKRIKF